MLVRGPCCPEITYLSLLCNKKFSTSFLYGTGYKKGGAGWDRSLCLNKRGGREHFLAERVSSLTPKLALPSDSLTVTNFPSAVLWLRL